MKTKQLIPLICAAICALTVIAFSQSATPGPATPAPPAPPSSTPSTLATPVVVINGTLDSATATTVAQARAKQALAGISAQGFRELRQCYLAAYNVVYVNHDGLTSAQVLSTLSTADAATLQGLQQQLYTILNTISPGSVPTPPAQ